MSARLPLILLALVYLLAGCERPAGADQPRQPIAAGDSTRTISSGGRERQYLLHIPPGYRPDVQMPLVLNFHYYSGDSARQARLTAMSADADRNGYIVAYPQALGSPAAWRIGEREGGHVDLVFVRDLVAALEQELAIDPRRIYATGMSNGAQMADRVGCELSDLVAAVAPVAGGYATWLDCTPARPVAVVAFHGTADRILPYAGQSRALLALPEWAAAWAKRNGCSTGPVESFRKADVVGQSWGGCREGADVVLYTVDGGGHGWPGTTIPEDRGLTTNAIDATAIIWAFFAAHPRP